MLSTLLLITSALVDKIGITVKVIPEDLRELLPNSTIVADS